MTSCGSPISPSSTAESGRMIGAEALVRWTHPEKGQLQPDQFIAAAEQGGRIDRLTYFVLDRALASIAPINRAGRPFTSPSTFRCSLLERPDLVPTVEALLRKHEVQSEPADAGGDGDLDPGQRRRADRQSAAAQRHGRAALDRRLWHRLFDARISEAHPGRRSSRSTAASFPCSTSPRATGSWSIRPSSSPTRSAASVVAEGVENEEILAELRRMGCDVVQGYHTGRPVPWRRASRTPRTGPVRHRRMSLRFDSVSQHRDRYDPIRAEFRNDPDQRLT